MRYSPRVLARLASLAVLAGCGRVERDEPIVTLLEEEEPNDSCDDAEDLGPAVTTVRGAFGDAGDVDRFRFEVEATTDVEIVTLPVADDGCGEDGRGSDTILTLLSGNCQDVLQTNDDAPGRAACSEISLSLEPDVYVLSVTVFVSDAGVPEIGSNPSYEIALSR